MADRAVLGWGWAAVASGVTPIVDHGDMAVEPRLDAWLEELDERDGTDILLTHDSPPLLRVDGRLTPLDGAEPLTGDEIEVIARSQIKDQYGDRLHQGRDVDFSFSWRDQARIRANAFYQRGNCSLSSAASPCGSRPRPSWASPGSWRASCATPAASSW